MEIKNTCEKQCAVLVRHAYKCYGSNKRKVIVLNKLNMTVPEGSIYGLLGASGCGKTTLLSCILGRKKLNSGKISVLGEIPGAKGGSIPGPSIGYMPQEIGLTGELTIQETLKYFGWISNIGNHQEIKKRSDFLIDFLMLSPNKQQMVKYLSGGQQRRVSLAAALIHDPQVLILDEPTVGLDSLLRHKVWDYLLKIAKEKQTTIIITTHYIEESRQADIIALMRGGHFLAEESPEKLLQRYNVENLEDVFLKLSIMQNDSSNSMSFLKSSSHRVENVKRNAFTEIKYLPPMSKISKRSLDVEHLRAIFWKNRVWIRQNVSILLFLICLPITQIYLFYLAIGHQPNEMPVAVIDHESNNSRHCYSTMHCNATQLGCVFLDYLQKRELKLTYFSDEKYATDLVLKGKMYGLIIIKHNYSLALRSRVPKWFFASKALVQNSEIDVIRDVFTVNTALFLKLYLYRTFQLFIQDYLESCHIHKKVLTLPVRFEKPIYGQNNPDFTDFAIPGLIVTTIFTLTTAASAGVIIFDKKDSNMERSFICGVSGMEMILSHLVSQLIVLTIQIILIVSFTFGVLQMTLNGSLALVIMLMAMCGICGLCFGFTISCVCKNEFEVTTMAMGSLFPMMILSGFWWPIQGMHYILQWFAYILPLTKNSESLRCILQQGLEFKNYNVYVGFISTGVWIVIFLLTSILFIKYQRN